MTARANNKFYIWGIWAFVLPLWNELRVPFFSLSIFWQIADEVLFWCDCLACIVVCLFVWLFFANQKHVCAVCSHFCQLWQNDSEASCPASPRLFVLVRVGKVTSNKAKHICAVFFLSSQYDTQQPFCRHAGWTPCSLPLIASGNASCTFTMFVTRSRACVIAPFTSGREPGKTVINLKCKFAPSVFSQLAVRVAFFSHWMICLLFPPPSAP